MPELTVSRVNNRITIVGRVQAVADRQLIRQLVDDAIAELRTERTEIVLDVAAAHYLDSFVLAQLVVLARKCLDCGLTLAVDGASDELLELLRVTKIDQVLQTHGARVTAARPAA